MQRVLDLAMGHKALRGQRSAGGKKVAVKKNKSKDKKAQHEPKKQYLRRMKKETKTGIVKLKKDNVVPHAAEAAPLLEESDDEAPSLSRQARKRLAFAAQIAAARPAVKGVEPAVVAPTVVAASAAPAAEASSLPETARGKKRTRAEAKALALQEGQHRSLYAVGDKTLLVGEGNFSFARALCRGLGSGAGVIATCFDKDTVLGQKYPDAAEIRKDVEDKFGATTLVGVDATRIHKVQEFKGVFKTIVWNFPHIGGGETDVEKSVVQHRKLLSDFFTSAAQCLSDERGAAIHVALKEGEPYKSWKIAQTFRASCPDLEMLTAVPFATTAWDGYAHRRTVGFDERISKKESEELAKGAKVYVFGRRKIKKDE